MNKWHYGYAYKRHPISYGETAVFSNGSKVKVIDILEELPDFMKKADILFVDPPWNAGNMKSFYTKAGKSQQKCDYLKFYNRLFECIWAINPKTVYVEIGKQYLADFIYKMKELYQHVTFFNSTYYHKKENICYVVKGSKKHNKAKLDCFDEEDIIKWVCANEEYDTIGDLCIGKGLVAVYATKAGRKFVGTELNERRVSVLLERLINLGLTYEIKLA